MRLMDLHEGLVGRTVVHERFTGALANWLLPMEGSGFGVVAVIDKGVPRQYAVSIKDDLVFKD